MPRPGLPQQGQRRPVGCGCPRGRGRGRARTARGPLPIPRSRSGEAPALGSGRGSPRRPSGRPRRPGLGAPPLSRSPPACPLGVRACGAQLPSEPPLTLRPGQLRFPHRLPNSARAEPTPLHPGAKGASSLLRGPRVGSGPWGLPAPRSGPLLSSGAAPEFPDPGPCTAVEDTPPLLLLGDGKRLTTLGA